MITNHHNLATSNDKNVSSHSSGGQKSGIKVLVGLHSLHICRRKSFLTLPVSGGSCIPCLWQHDSNSVFSLYMPQICQISLSFLLQTCPSLDLEPTVDPGSQIKFLNFVIPAKILFENKVNSQELGVGI